VVVDGLAFVAVVVKTVVVGAGKLELVVMVAVMVVSVVGRLGDVRSVGSILHAVPKERMLRSAEEPLDSAVEVGASLVRVYTRGVGVESKRA